MEKQSFIYAINKEKGPSSHKVVSQIRKITGIKKVGHAGTLDPLASGVLVIGITREGTKTMHEHVKTEKEYRAVIELGQTSSTDDAEGEKTVTADPVKAAPSEKEIQSVLKKFIGNIEQIPPIYSALKIKGKPAYKYAREGKELEMQARPVIIKSIQLVNYQYPKLEIDVVTGPGVYIRSLARDIGSELKTGGYLSALERTKVGEYRIEDALSLEEFEKIWKKRKNVE